MSPLYKGSWSDCTTLLHTCGCVRNLYVACRIRPSDHLLIYYHTDETKHHLSAAAPTAAFVTRGKRQQAWFSTSKHQEAVQPHSKHALENSLESFIKSRLHWATETMSYRSP